MRHGSRTAPRLKSSPGRLWLVAGSLLLACSLGRGSGGPPPIVMLTRLPTFTATPVAPNPAPALPAPTEPPPTAAPALSSPTATATTTLAPAVAEGPGSPTAPPSPLPPPAAPTLVEANPPPATPPPPVETEPPPAPPPATSLPTRTPPPANPAPPPAGWDFVGVRTVPDPLAEGLLVYGDALNNTGSPQELSLISGTFYDAQGTVIAGADTIFDYWPVELVPAGQRLPFELAIPGINQATTFELQLEAQPYGQPLALAVTFEQVEQWADEAGSYCLSGQVLASPTPQEFLVIVAVLYDGADDVLKFAEYYAPEPAAVGPAQPLEFDLCLEPPAETVARYELRAWGQ